MAFTKVSSAPNRALADLACQMLQQNGIEAFPKLGLGAWAVDIWVQEKDAADAAKLLPPP